MDCKDRYVCHGHGHSHAHIPYRDKASQAYLKATFRRGESVAKVDQNEHGGSPSEASSPRAVQSDTGEEEEVADWVPELPTDAEAAWPTLEEYKDRWAAGKAWYAFHVLILLVGAFTTVGGM